MTDPVKRGLKSIRAVYDSISTLTGHYTIGGVRSMDPAKWCVMRFEYQDDTGSYPQWGVYPPHSTAPHLVTQDWAHAVEWANRYAMFAVVPPESMPDMLRGNTIEEQESEG